MGTIIDTLLALPEPSIRYQVRLHLLGEESGSAAMMALREEIRTSPRVQALLAERDATGRIPPHTYRKWTGAHWVLATLADLGYPPGDADLQPLVEQVCATWLHPQHVERVPVIEGRARRCGSQEGNTLFALLTLDMAPAQADQLAANLLRWQWPDGGWNCDKRPAACHSSFHETWLPLRGLALYARRTGHTAAGAAARRAAELFLQRRLLWRQSTGAPISAGFCKLCYPSYWRYDLLSVLTVLAEAGFITDPRCAEALDLLESKRLPHGGFPAEARYWRGTGRSVKSARSAVDWGSPNSTRLNPWVTVKALMVLRAAGRE